jgi:hypothetical protein
MGDIDPTNDPSRVVDATPFPDPSLYFRVFDSEADEPDAKYRKDVLKLYERWEKKYGRKVRCEAAVVPSVVPSVAAGAGVVLDD